LLCFFAAGFSDDSDVEEDTADAPLMSSSKTPSESITKYL